MADIIRRLGWRHLRTAPTAHVRHFRRGRLVHDGPGLSFWFRALTAALSEIPVDDRELAMAFHARTSDFQDVTVQATVTYRISEPATAAARLDFSIDPDTGVWRGVPLEQLSTLLTETAQQHALDVLARTPLAAALVDGVAAVLERITDGLAAEPRLPATGITVVAVRVVALRPEPEVERALRTPRANRSSRSRTGRRTSAGPSPWSVNARSPRTNWRAGSNWPAVRSSWSSSTAPTPAARPRRTPRRTP